MNVQNVLDILNKKTQNILGSSIPTNIIQPMEFTSFTKTGVTICPKTNDAFILNPPIAGIIKNTPHGDNIDNAAIYRGLLGYVAADMASKNDVYFTFMIVAMVNQGLRELTKEIGYLGFREVTAERPGEASVYFTDEESSAAFEFRLRVKEK